MGRLRAPYLEAEWGSETVDYMRRLKHIFDEDDLLNPEVMFSQKSLFDDLAPLLKGLS